MLEQRDVLRISESWVIYHFSVLSCLSSKPGLGKEMHTPAQITIYQAAFYVRRRIWQGGTFALVCNATSLELSLLSIYTLFTQPFHQGEEKHAMRDSL